MKTILAVLITSSTVAAVAMLAKSEIVLRLLWATLRFAPTVLPDFTRIVVKLVV